jgi:ABC-type polysaccharide/polyol phosphate export permease
MSSVAGQIAEGGVGRLRRLLAYRSLVRYLVLKEIKVRSRGTYLGVAWTLMNPLLTIVVYFVVFQYIFKVNIPNFLAFFLVGFLMWIFFSRTITTAATCILENEAIIKKTAFPLETLPLSVVLHNLFHHVMALAIALPLMLIFWGGKVSVGLLWVVLVLGGFVGFTLAVSLWLSTVGLLFRDARDILDVGLPILLWLTPIFYTPEMAPQILRPVLAANPLATFIGAVRTGLLEGRAPSGVQMVSIALWVTVPLVVGTWIFARHSARFAEEL